MSLASAAAAAAAAVIVITTTSDERNGIAIKAWWPSKTLTSSAECHQNSVVWTKPTEN